MNTTFVLVLLMALSIACPSASACSAFAAKLGGDQIVAKNFDWSDGRGFVVVNQRGRVRQPFSGVGAGWTARYGSLSLTVLGPGLPVSGMNEAGLVFEALVDLEGTTTGGSEAALVSLEWGQYVLDRFDSIDDVVRSARERGVRQLVLPLHFFVCDRNGHCAVVELRNGKVEVVSGSGLRPRVLANGKWRNDLAASAAFLSSNPVTRWFTPGDYSHVRFARLSSALSDNAPGSRSEVFELLDAARIPARNRWQLLWNQSHLALSYRLRDDSGVVSAEGEAKLPSMDFACEDGQQVASLHPGARKFALRPYGEADREAVATRLRAIMLGVRGAKDFALQVATYTASSRCANMRQ